MKFYSLYFYLFLGTLAIPLAGICQSHKIDSLYAVLKTEKEDTNRVNTFNNLSRLMYDKGNLHKTDSLAKNALKLAEKLNYKSGIGNAYNNIGNVCLSQGNYAEALKAKIKFMKIFEEIGNKQALGGAYGDIGIIYYSQGNYIDALTNESKSLKIMQELGNKTGIGLAYLNIGNIYSVQGNYPEALKNELLGLKIAEELGSKGDMGNAYTNVGAVYEHLGNHLEALKNMTLALKIYEALGDKSNVSNTYGNIGVVYSDMGNFSEAINSELQGLKIDQEIGNKGAMGTDYGNIGSFYYGEGKYDEALSNDLNALKIDEEIGDKYDLSYVYLYMGMVYTKQKEYTQAKLYLDSSVTQSKVLGNKEVLRESFKGWASLDSATSNFKSAYQDYKNYVIYHDSMQNDENTKKIVSEQMTYEFDKKRGEEKAAQDKKDAIHDEEVKKQKIVIYSVSCGLLLVLLLAGTIFRSLRLNRKKTQIIVEQKAVVEEKNSLIEQQKILVEEKNKDILDSITYAKRLQDAILPPLSVIKNFLPESFVLYKPKDIVAGDFYWMERTGDDILIAACDCTGHGVPGAMVSIVCSNALNRTVKEFRITDTGKILDKVRELVIETFEKSESIVQDGMDISLCCLNIKTKETQWSGANNPLWYIHNNELKEVIPDKQPIGKFDLAKPFNTNNIKLEKGDTFYLFTDGYADQFGGPKGKKFKYKTLQEKLLAMTNISMDKQKEMLQETIEQWKGSLEQVDDILVMGIRV